MKITIEKSGINGEGIGYSEKKPVFVSGALPGETVLVKQVEDHGSYKTAETAKILEASPMRRESPCPYAKDCGSCELICAKPELQLSIKKSLLEEALLKYADIEADVEVTSCPDEFHYRNSLKLPVGERQGRLITGMYRSNSNSLVPIDTCLLHEEILEEVRKKCLEILTEAGHHVYDRKTLTGIRFLHIRSMKGKVQLTVITGHDRLEQDTVKKLSEIPSVVSLWQSVNTGRGKEIFGHQMIHLAGSKVLQFQVKGLKMKLSPRSFYQMNTYQAVALYDKVLKHIGENENVVEAYSGIG
ncbi:MAG: class I SAM-dependent RNA methyltransferase, partial [Erysipelotrichaceae bacterium]|nr:class I SAM-dependent RNA methyltransferase [Erysipelotrichaceae bacterium]